MVATGICESSRVMLGEALAQRRAECGEGERPLAQQRLRPGQDRREIDPCQGRPYIPMGGELSIEDRPEQRPQTEAVLRRQEMDGAADRRDPDHASLDQRRPEIRLLERFQPRPQARVRICRHLSLEADEMAHRRHHVEGPAGKEQLPLQRRPVEGSRGDHLRHALTLARYPTGAGRRDVEREEVVRVSTPGMFSLHWQT